MAQIGLSNTRIAQILAIFLIFFILTSPQLAGAEARSFASWLGDGLEAVGTFLDGVFADQSS
ncbi:MAG: hypothetical protein ACFCVK_00870 [Acidimicrobiales bacterium]